MMLANGLQRDGCSKPVVQGQRYRLLFKESGIQVIVSVAEDLFIRGSILSLRRGSYGVAWLQITNLLPTSCIYAAFYMSAHC